MREETCEQALATLKEAFKSTHLKISSKITKVSVSAFVISFDVCFDEKAVYKSPICVYVFCLKKLEMLNETFGFYNLFIVLCYHMIE